MSAIDKNDFQWTRTKRTFKKKKNVEEFDVDLSDEWIDETIADIVPLEIDSQIPSPAKK